MAARHRRKRNTEQQAAANAEPQERAAGLTRTLVKETRVLPLALKPENLAPFSGCGLPWLPLRKLQPFVDHRTPLGQPPPDLLPIEEKV
jgi:hypothetical protein